MFSIILKLKCAVMIYQRNMQRTIFNCFFFSPVGPFLNILTHFSFLNSFTLDILEFGAFSSVSYLLLKQFENFSGSIVLLYY